MRVVLEVRQELSRPISLKGINLSGFFAFSTSELQKVTLTHLGRPLLFGEIFKVNTADSDRDEVIFTGSTRMLNYCGHGLSSGRVIIDGNTGSCAGMEMSGGELTVKGDAGSCLGVALTGGKITVLGNAGDWCGAALAGESKGMNGGLILVGGNAGCELGSAMQRGLIAVAGNCDKYAGSRMYAGTIICLGDIGAHPGLGMQRGSLVTGTIGSILPGFKPAGFADTGWLRLYLNWLPHNGFTIPSGWLERSPGWFSGDHLASGKGEILAYEFPQ